jgi:transcriptional regulator with XRE-family HTH domain
MSIRDRFDAAIGRSGVKNLTELATLLGVSAPSLSQVLSGQRVGKTLLPRIAGKLGVHERWLRFGDDDVKPPWALSRDLADPLQALSAAVRASQARPPKLLDVLSEILSEQRRIRVLLERCADAGEVVPRRRADIRRAADGAGTAVPRTDLVIDG